MRFIGSLLLLSFAVGVSSIHIHHHVRDTHLIYQRNIMDSVETGPAPTQTIVCHDQGIMDQLITKLPKQPQTRKEIEFKTADVNIMQAGDGGHYWTSLSPHAKKFKCFDEGMQYKDASKYDGTEDAVISGCAIYRTKATLLQQIVGCMDKNVWKWTTTMGNGNILKFLSQYALESANYATWLQTVTTNIPNLVDTIIRSDNRFKTPVLDKRSPAELISTLTKCLRLDESDVIKTTIREAFVCLPNMMSAPGVLSHGLGEHNYKVHGLTEADFRETKEPREGGALATISAAIAFNKFGYEWNNNGVKIGKQLLNVQIQAACPVHPMCARLAIDKLRNWNHVLYSMKSSTHPSSWSYCSDYDLTASEPHRCRYFARCFSESLKRVCADHLACCPSVDMRSSCANDVLGDRVYDSSPTIPGSAAACHICSVDTNRIDLDVQNKQWYCETEKDKKAPLLQDFKPNQIKPITTCGTGWDKDTPKTQAQAAPTTVEQMNNPSTVVADWELLAL